jgi:60 kDa SS-A/Ro ribonucleoprotein
LYAYLIVRTSHAEALPESVPDYEAFKAGEMLEMPKVPFAMLTPLPLGKADWMEIARNAPWRKRCRMRWK